MHSVHAAEIRDRLHGRLRGRPTPLLVFEDAVIPAASCWAGARAWIKAGRQAGLVDGDGVVLDVEHGPVFVIVVIAALWEGWRLILPACDEDREQVQELARQEQARALISARGGAAVWHVRDWMSPGEPELRDAPAKQDRTAAWSVAGSAVPWSRLRDALVPNPCMPSRVWMRQAWRTADGLVGELLPALATCEEVFHDPLPPPEASFVPWSEGKVATAS